MINKKIIASTISILSVAAMMGGATFAFFSDSGTSTGNTFSTGNLEMKLSDNNEEDLDNITTTWGLTAAMPGDTFTRDVRVTNTGSVPANHIELQFANGTPTEGSGPGAVATTPLPSVVEVTSLLWDNDGDGNPTVNLLAGVTDTNTNGIVDLADVANQVADDFDDLLFQGTQTTDHVLRMTGRLSPTLAVNQHQGDSVTMTLNVTMNQDTTQ